MDSRESNVQCAFGQGQSKWFLFTDEISNSSMNTRSLRSYSSAEVKDFSRIAYTPIDEEHINKFFDYHESKQLKTLNFRGCQSIVVLMKFKLLEVVRLMTLSIVFSVKLTKFRPILYNFLFK